MSKVFAKIVTRSHLKNRFLVQGRGGAEFQTGGILEYFEDLKRGTNKDIGPKDIFEVASNNKLPYFSSQEKSARVQMFRVLLDMVSIDCNKPYQHAKKKAKSQI
jgi:hypothetical protein